MGDKRASRSPRKERSRRHRSRSRSADKHRRRKDRSPRANEAPTGGREEGRHRRRHSRERKKDGSRSGSRSPRHSRKRKSAFSGPGEGAQAQSLQQLQQQQLQRQLLAQQLLLQQNALSGTTALIANKKQREVYVGNLTIGIVNADMLRELFNGALSSLVPDPVTNPPVVSVNMDASGRFGFVEMRSEELANAAMQMDKVELCGRHVNIGRPRGYIEPPTNVVAQTKLGVTEQFAKSTPGTGSKTCLLENMLSLDDLNQPNARPELMEEVQMECEKWATVLGVACPTPPDSMHGVQVSRVYVKLSTPDEAKRTKEFMDGRTFDNNTVSCTLVPDGDFGRAEKGEWIST